MVKFENRRAATNKGREHRKHRILPFAGRYGGIGGVSVASYPRLLVLAGEAPRPRPQCLAYPPMKESGGFCC